MGEAAVDLVAADMALADQISKYASDPLGYVMFAFDWTNDPDLHLVELKEPWASKYKSKYGPDVWQCEFLDELGEAIRARGFKPSTAKTVRPVRGTVGSGHGIGKSALVGMLACFLMDTRPKSIGTVTANTGEQLRNKTFSQIATWRNRSITAHWWNVSTGGLFIRHRELEMWKLTGVTWRKEASEAFAGQHEATSTSYYLFDEASLIHTKIFEVSEGGLTDGEPMHFSFGNVTRADGEFYKTFHRNKHRYDICKQIDSRDSQLTNKEQIKLWEEDYGEDSDFFRVRVRGLPPRTGANNMFGHDLIRQAVLAQPTQLRDDACVMGVDVARFGNNESKIKVRRGKDARTRPMRCYRGKDTHQLSALIIEEFDECNVAGMPVQMIFVDGGGVGGGVIDNLSHRGYPVTEVLFGGKADRPDRYKQKDAEMWGTLKEWMRTGGAIEDDPQLHEQLTARPYDYTPTQALYLWPKDKCEEELGIESPDRADALALTFAFPVHPATIEALQQGNRCVT
ncbi:MAG: hypothetical protein M3094_04480, partial [Actinomycetia bacterium]|nr:hypothetical protein [Actinomycetes bacterium]